MEKPQSSNDEAPSRRLGVHGVRTFGAISGSWRMFHLNVMFLLTKAPVLTKMIQAVVGNVSVAARNVCTLRCGLCAPKAAQYKSSAVSPSGQSVGKARLGLTETIGETRKTGWKGRETEIKAEVCDSHSDKRWTFIYFFKILKRYRIIQQVKMLLSQWNNERFGESVDDFHFRCRFSSAFCSRHFPKRHRPRLHGFGQTAGELDERRHQTCSVAPTQMTAQVPKSFSKMNIGSGSIWVHCSCLWVTCFRGNEEWDGSWSQMKFWLVLNVFELFGSVSISVWPRCQAPVTASDAAEEAAQGPRCGRDRARTRMETPWLKVNCLALGCVTPSTLE